MKGLVVGSKSTLFRRNIILSEGSLLKKYLKKVFKTYLRSFVNSFLTTSKCKMKICLSCSPIFGWYKQKKAGYFSYKQIVSLICLPIKYYELIYFFSISKLELISWSLVSNSSYLNDFDKKEHLWRNSIASFSSISSYFFSIYNFTEFLWDPVISLLVLFPELLSSRYEGFMFTPACLGEDRSLGEDIRITWGDGVSGFYSTLILEAVFKGVVWYSLIGDTNSWDFSNCFTIIPDLT